MDKHELPYGDFDTQLCYRCGGTMIITMDDVVCTNCDRGYADAMVLNYGKCIPCKQCKERFASIDEFEKHQLEAHD